MLLLFVELAAKNRSRQHQDPVQPARPRFVLHPLRRPTLYRLAVTMTCRIAENNLVPCRTRNRGLHTGFPSARIRSRKISKSTGFPIVLSAHIYVALGHQKRKNSI